MTIPKDLATGLVVLAVCGALYTLTTQFDTDPLGMTQGMPATMMPRLILAVISSLSVLMIIQGLRATREQGIALPPWQMWATAGVLALCALLFVPLGVPLTFFSVCIIIPILWGARNYRAVMTFALALPIAILVVFQGLLGLRLPLGPLSGLGL